MINGFTHERVSQISVYITSNPATKDMRLCAYERLDCSNNLTTVQPAFVFSSWACHSMGFSFKFKLDIIKLSTRAISIPIKGCFICSPFLSMAYASCIGRMYRQMYMQTNLHLYQMKQERCDWYHSERIGILVYAIYILYMLYNTIVAEVLIDKAQHK